jgi:uncharacterized membrane protein
MVSVGGLTLGLAAIATHRRNVLPPDERFVVPYREWLAAGRAELFEPQSRTDAVLNVVLVCSVVLAVASVGYAVAVPNQGESFSELYLLTENETGELVADDYPTEFAYNESKELIVGVGNEEHEQTTYTVIVELQNVTVVDNRTRVNTATELHRFQPTVAHNSTWHQRHTITPQQSGTRLRLQYLLYRGTPPTPLNRSAAYREVHLWVTVQSPELTERRAVARATG